MILTVCYKIILSWTAILWHCDVGSLKKNVQMGQIPTQWFI